MKRDDHRAQDREQPEPHEGNRPVPRVVLLLVAGLIIWGVGYIASHTGWPLAGGDSRTPIVVVETADDISGERIYSNECAACHQDNGQGVVGSFPPLVDTEWVTGDPDVPVAIIYDGLHGPIEVAGTTYDGEMPAVGQGLSAAEVAAVTTYIRSAWGNDASAVTTEEVEGYRERFPDRAMWTAEELRAEFDAPSP